MSEVFVVFGEPHKGKTRLDTNDKAMEKLWEELEDVPFDEDTDGYLRLSQPWHGFPAGTDREDIWHWFDENHSKGVAWLLYEYKKSYSNT